MLAMGAFLEDKIRTVTILGDSTATSTNESMPLLGCINEGQLGNLKAIEA